MQEYNWKRVVEATVSGDLSMSEVARKLNMTVNQVHGGRITAERKGITVRFAKETGSVRQKRLQRIMLLANGTRGYQEIAGILGVSREDLTRLVSDLRKHGYRPNILLSTKPRSNH